MASLRTALLALPLLAVGCHPGACWYPGDFPTDAPREITSSADNYPAEKVDVAFDELGVPHIYAQTDFDLAYAEGFIHARDRLWQIFSQKFGIFGRLSEFRGEAGVSSDKAARMLVYGIDEQFEALPQSHKDLLEAYAAGVNDGADFVGNTTVEMTVLGAEWEPYTAKDCLGLVRYFGWDLSTGMYEELMRNLIVNRLEEDDPRYAELLQPTKTLGHPVVRAEEHSGLGGFTPDDALPLEPTSLSSSRRRVETKAPTRGLQRKVPDDIRAIFDIGERPSGASNAWGISGEHTTTGNAVFSHDPHLRHSGPGLFYLVHMEGPDYTIAGASVPGVPGVLLGHGRHVSWGTPVSNVDVQDLVRITPYEGRDDLYLLDGEPREYETLTQVFKLDQGDDAETVEEVWKITEFGPILGSSYDAYLDEGEQFSFMWPGHKPLNPDSSVVNSLWDLAKSTNVEEATAAIQKLTAPAITMNMAFTDGTIAYRLSGDIPVRASDEPVSLPRDGTSSSAGWLGRLPPDYKPQLRNPDRGYIVTANQRVIDDDGPVANIIGWEGSRPFRAMRITERIDEKLADGGKISPQEVWDIQQDHVSIEARNLAPVFAAHCPSSVADISDDMAASFCTELQSFSGSFNVDSKGATVFQWLERQVREEILAAHFDAELARRMKGYSFIRTALYQAMLDSEAGEEPAILDDPSTDAYDGVGVFVERAAAAVLPRLKEKLGEDAGNWRWGNIHKLSFKGALNAIPVVGPWLFSTESREENGCGECVRAENGRESTDDDITNGAVIRIFAEMSNPPQVRVIVDTGQSGHFGHRHFEDQYPLWTSGEPIILQKSLEEVKAENEGLITFLPK